MNPESTTAINSGATVAALVFIVALAVVALVCFAFWLWMLIECLTKESSEGNDKLVWALLIFFLPVLGSLLYFFIRRPTRRAALGR